MRVIRPFIAGGALLLCGSFVVPAHAVDRPDTWITTKVKIALLASAETSAKDVNVDTTQGRVVLHGTVGSDAEKSKTEQVARTVEGVREVRNLLAVVPPPAQDSVEKNDEQISKAVSTALREDPALRDSEISVKSVNGGVVYLTGKANSLTDQLRAMEHAVSVSGVRHVATEISGPETLSDNDIWHGTKSAAHSANEGSKDALQASKEAAKDVGNTMSDAWITTETKARLLANGDTPGLEINVDTRNGAVTLFGMVPSESAKTAAAAEARKVSGVRSVKNQLQVVSSARQDLVKRNDEEIRTEVERRMQSLSGADIDVEVKNGIVRMSGTVDQSSDYLEAMVIARSTSGVRSIVADDLRVETKQ